MPTFKFTGPDNKTYQVTGPEGSTAQEAFTHLQSQIGEQPSAEPGGVAGITGMPPLAPKNLDAWTQAHLGQPAQPAPGEGNFPDQPQALQPPEQGPFGYTLPTPRTKADFSQFKNARKPVTTRSINIGPARPETPEDTKAMPERQWNMLAGQVESLTSKPSGMFGDTEAFGRDVLRHAGVPVSAEPMLPTSEFMGNLEWGQPTSPEQAAGRERGVGTFLAPQILGKTVGAYARGTDWLARPIVGGLNKAKEWATGSGFTDPYATATQRLAQSVNNPQRMLENIRGWRGESDPSFMDIAGSDRTLRLARSAASDSTGDASTVAKDYAKQVAADAQGNTGALARGLTPNEPRSVVDVRADLVKTRAEAANPLYEKSNRGGSIAPLQSQYEDAFNAASKNVIDAQRAVDDAQNAVADAQHRTTLTDNVYAQSSALKDLRDAQAAHEDAVKAQTAAESQKAAVLERLRTAQADAASNKRGAIWSPRLQQFLDSPEAKAGLNVGLTIERRKALAANRPYDPTEYGITGTDGAGNPVIAKVPNMRLLDAVKQGIDAILEKDYPRDPVTGRQYLDKPGQSLDDVRKALVVELDRLNPDYGPARAQYQKDTAPIEALRAGTKATGTPAVEYGPTIARLAERHPGARAAAAVGHRQDIVTNIGRPKEGAVGYLNKLGSATEERQKLGTSFGPEAAADFQKGIQDEVSRMENARFIDPRTGSQTFSHLVDMGLIGKMTSGNWFEVLKTAADWVRRGGPLTEAERTAIVQLASSQSKGDWLRVIEKLPQNSRPAARQILIPGPGASSRRAP